MDKQVLVIDNYDSFVYNLVALVRNEGYKVTVRRNDKIEPEEALSYPFILLSPGPGIPDEAGQMKAIIKASAGQSSILGVCLGHQAIAEVYHETLFNLSSPLHGIATNCNLTQQGGLFERLPAQFEVARYHSWAVKQISPESELEALAVDDEGIILAIRHKQKRIWGVQFHPESVLTPLGPQIIKNWLAS